MFLITINKLFNRTNQVLHRLTPIASNVRAMSFSHTASIETVNLSFILCPFTHAASTVLVWMTILS